jgi:Nucleoside-diphosphate-sugar epimerases
VLEPLSGYLLLAEHLVNSGPEYSGAWNFGPKESSYRQTEWIVREICGLWGGQARYKNVPQDNSLHETRILKLDYTKAHVHLKWAPRWELGQVLESIVEWTKAYVRGENMRTVTARQIEAYLSEGSGR